MKNNLRNQDIRTEIHPTIESKNLILIDMLFKSGVDIYNSLPVKNKNILVQLEFEDDYYSNKLVQKIYKLNLTRLPTVDINEIKKAIYYAKKYHGDQKRQSGEPYYFHPIEVAYMVTVHCFKTDIIVTSILHDIVEDTNFTVQMVEIIFGSTVASQVESLTRNKTYKKLSIQEIIEPLYQQGEVDVLIIKMFDRLHNMRTISFKSAEKQYKTTLETIEIFIPLAQYLQLPKVKQELIDICMATLNSLSSNFSRVCSAELLQQPSKNVLKK